MISLILTSKEKTLSECKTCLCKSSVWCVDSSSKQRRLLRRGTELAPAVGNAHWKDGLGGWWRRLTGVGEAPKSEGHTELRVQVTEGIGVSVAGFLWLPWQVSIDVVAQSNTNWFSLSSGSQESKIKVLAGLCSLQRLKGRTHSLTLLASGDSRHSL